MNIRRLWQLYVAVTLVVLSSGMAEGASASYLVNVNTSTVNGSSGFLDFQFNPGNPSSQLATAQVTNFNAGLGSLVFNVNSPQRTGDASGTLPGVVTLVNDTGFNDYFQEFIYGMSFSFVLTLSGPALSSPNGTATAGSTFGIGLYDQDQNSILTDQGAGTGFAGSVDVNLDGTTTVQAFPTDTDGPSVFTAVPTPEPGSVLLLALGLAGLTALKSACRP